MEQSEINWWIKALKNIKNQYLQKRRYTKVCPLCRIATDKSKTKQLECRYCLWTIFESKLCADALYEVYGTYSKSAAYARKYPMKCKRWVKFRIKQIDEWIERLETLKIST